MSISAGVNRLGKVIFGLSVVGVIVMLGLLWMGREGAGIRGELLVYCTLAAVGLIAGGIMEVHNRRTWMGVCGVLYVVPFTAFMVNKLPNADIMIAVVVLCVPPIVFAILTAIVKYVIHGFASKA